MGKLIFLITLAGFVYLAAYSWGRTHAPERHVMEDRVKPAPIWKTKKAATIASIYGVSPEELDKPASIWGEQ